LFDDALVKEDNLLSVFEDIHDYIYANDGLSPQQTLEEFIKILFLKIVDEQLNQYNFSVILNQKDNLNNAIADLFLTTKKNYPDIFDIDDKVRLSSVSLKYALYKLKDIALLSSSTDVKGLAFQKFLSHREKDGHGQFFTPVPVIDFCVSMLNISCHDKVIDPACGSAGFLLSSLKYIKSHNINIDLASIIQKNLYGIEINKSVARLAKMKLFLESNVLPNIICANALVEHMSLDGQFDVVLANPPFGAKISEEAVLNQFDLGHKLSMENGSVIRKTVLSNQNGDILFLEKCLKLLKPKG
jgi:type I restriction enzyme M protein